MHNSKPSMQSNSCCLNVYKGNRMCHDIGIEIFKITTEIFRAGADQFHKSYISIDHRKFSRFRAFAKLFSYSIPDGTTICHPWPFLSVVWNEWIKWIEMVMGMEMISALNIIKKKINNIVVNATTDTIKMKLQFNKNTNSNWHWQNKNFKCIRHT